MASKEAKLRVNEKFTLAKDMKDAKIKVSVESIEKVDGKFAYAISIYGLPRKKDDDSIDSYRRIPKIANDWEELSAYVKDVFSKSDEEIIKLCQEA